MAGLFIRPVLALHSVCYHLAGRYGIILNNGVHPKHDIIKYEEIFCNHIEPGWTILDIGSNTGLLTYALATKAKHVYGIEINKQHYDVAIQKNTKKNIDYINSDATRYNYELDRSIHCITMSNVLEHIDNRVDFLKAIIHKIQWSKTSKPCILIRVPMINREWIVLYKKQLGLEYRLDATHYIEYTLEILKDELAQADININKTIIQYGEIFVQCSFVKKP